jgi:GTP pyrophosphokinase
LEAHCIGAKVNHKLVPISHKLRSGDQVEIITSNKQKPSDNWLKFVVTARQEQRSKIHSKKKKEKLQKRENSTAKKA